jgi:hypothetical protein
MSKSPTSYKHSDATVLAIIRAPTLADAVVLGGLLGVHASVIYRWHRLEDRRALRLAVANDVRGINSPFVGGNRAFHDG